MFGQHSHNVNPGSQHDIDRAQRCIALQHRSIIMRTFSVNASVCDATQCSEFQRQPTHH